MKRTSFLSMAAAGVAGAAAPALAQSALTPLTAAPNVAYDQVVYYYAQQAGLFTKAGLDVTTAPAASGSAGLLAVVGGAAQIGFTNTLSFSTAYAKGIPILAIAPAGLYETATPLARVMVSADSPLRSAHDLDGRTIAVAGLHDLLSLCTTAWLAQAGIDVSRVRYLEMPASAMIAAVQAKRADAMTIYEPYVIAAEAAGLHSIGKPYDALALTFEPGVWFVSATWGTQHRDAVLRFAGAMREAVTYVSAHYSELLPMVNAFTKIDVETLRKMPVPHWPPALRPSLLQPVIDAAVKFHELAAPFRAQDAIFPGLAA